MKLYFSPGACSLAPHIVLEELGLKYEGVKVDLRNKPQELLKANPKGYVPVLELDDGKVLTEAQVILQYLADQKPEKHLLPKMGTWERYQAMELLNFLSTEVHKGFGPLWHLKELATTPEGMEHVRAVTIRTLSKKFDFLASILKKQPFLLGDRFSACDAYLVTLLGWTRLLKVDLTPWPELMGYVEKAPQIPCVQSAMRAEGLMK
ncbi:MAG: glutathione transferase GstA [Bdellovibrionaceae bacterium]|nr:glutathione transferase GstA [Pseudobdellovibrionaceae bacterium]MBX3034936.1 glutathione transferase GstA [Pseudobdellovibrionaceae bacterium]